MVCGLHFDAAIDCDWTLHCYGEREKDVTPIELYCFDHTEWDIRMMLLMEVYSTRAPTWTKSRPRHVNGCAK